MFNVPVIIQVVFLNVQHDCNCRLHVQEASCILASLRDKNALRAYARASAQRVHASSDMHSRIESAVKQHLRDHARCGRLAMRSADAHRVMMPCHQLPEQFRAFDLRDPVLCGIRALRVVRMNGCRINQQSCASNVFSRVSDRYRYAHIL